ncbi:MAG: efflux RND transporter periplasmic adaptor subunit [Pseudomonadota bacterium]
MSLKKQLAVVLVLLLALAAGVHWFAGGAGDDADAATGRGDKPTAVDTITAEQRILARKIEAVGTTRARQSIDVRPSVSGRLVEVPFTPGSLVRKGDLLARLDSASEEADVAEARAERRQASLALERATALAERNTIAMATLDELEAGFDAADARLQRAEKRLADRTIAAPFDGKIGLKQVDIGAYVDDETVIATLDDLAEIEIDFRAPEIYFGEVAPGQKIEATSAAFGTKSFEGSIATVDSRIDPVSRAFQVRARLPNPDFILPAGMFMLVELTLAERDALTVPEAAVTLFDREASVFVIVDGRAERRTVELGQREVGYVEVVAGLEEGEQVVVTGLQRLRPGAKVTISEAPSS